jgi:hypothetical protein
MKRRCGTARIAGLIRQALKNGQVVDIEGLGTFRPNSNGFKFLAETRPSVFLAYVREDIEVVRRLYKDLIRAGYQPWMDEQNLLPGQNWPRAIDRAIDVSDFFIPCFSKRSVPKRGIFQSELRYALDCAARLPLDDIFVIPVRLDDCALPQRIDSHLQHVDLFPTWVEGMEHIRKTIDHEAARRRKQQMKLAG